jgi:arabinogalactan endo-1,4-beta-galactosidase
MTKQDKEFIVNLSKQMKNQDNRMTASPYGYVIGHIKSETVEEECKVSNLNDSSNITTKIIYEDEPYTKQEFYTYLDNLYAEDNNQIIFIYKVKTLLEKCKDFSYCEDEIVDLAERYKQQVSFVTIHNTYTTEQTTNYGNFFLTEESANQYIKNNKHNMPDDPYIYLTFLYRNPEMEQLQQVIHKLAEEYDV